MFEPLYNVEPLIPVETMSSYPNMLTPPSSSEDSPAPLYYVASPDSNSFHDPVNYGIHNVYPNIPQQIVVNTSELMDTLPVVEASLQIIEQPTDRFRFRYKSEMAGTHGSLTGYNSCKSRKQTYPTVQLRNCQGPAIIRCSIYQVNEKGKDMKPHAHRLIMKRGKDEHDDPHNIKVGPEDDYKAVFHGMGIIHTAKKNIVSELEKKKTQLYKESIARIEGKFRELTTKERVEIKGLADSESKSINLNIVCLRFDAFIKQNDILFPICAPVYSHGINNLKSALTGDLKIVRLDHVVCEAKGDKEIFILVERVTKKNIKIRFFETNDDDQVVWEAEGKFNDLDVHHQYAIVFRTPPYKDQNITRPVNVFIELVRPSDNARSEPRDFRYTPNRERCKPGQKRARYDYSSSSYNSSNLGSDEIPAVVNQMEMSNNIPSSLGFPSIPDDMLKAMKDIDSNEFKKFFNDIGPDLRSLLGTDAPKDLNRKGTSSYHSEMANLPPLIKLEVSREEQNSVTRLIEEFKSFMKTRPTQQRADQMLNHHLGEDKKTNAFHISICQNNMEAAIFILRMLIHFKRLELINIMNSENQTYLHLAVLCHNVIMVRQLLINGGKVGIQDNDLNTILHVAIRCHAPVEIVTMLLCNRENEAVSEYLNALNSDGYSALMLAIEYKSLAALKLLNMKKADVNIMHSKDGFVPLRLAIEKRYMDGIKFLLSLGIDPTIKDFRGISPLNAALQKEDEPELINIIKDYMNKHNLSIEVKEEYDSEDNMDMEDDDVDVKPQIPLEELEKHYEKLSNFTPQCLDEVSAILNRSGKWEDLADLLDIRHIISSGVISDSNISKSLLTFAVETNNDSLWIIRNFLENLDEPRAVELMDRMVQEYNF